MTLSVAQNSYKRKSFVGIENGVKLRELLRPLNTGDLWNCEQVVCKWRSLNGWIFGTEPLLSHRNDPLKDKYLKL